jgi:hypothetical protein
MSVEESTEESAALLLSRHLQDSANADPVDLAPRVADEEPIVIFDTRDDHWERTISSGPPEYLIVDLRVADDVKNGKDIHIDGMRPDGSWYLVKLIGTGGDKKTASAYFRRGELGLGPVQITIWRQGAFGIYAHQTTDLLDAATHLGNRIAYYSDRIK